MSDQIQTTHAGSLPRPDDLVEMIWGRMDGEGVDEGALQARIDSAVTEVVAKQREVGIDLVSDGEFSKTGFYTYVADRFSGFEGDDAHFQTDDLVEFPNLAMRLFNTDSIKHASFSTCVGPVALTDQEAVRQDVARMLKALGDSDPSTGFLGTVSPGQITFAFPDRHYGSEEAYLEAVGAAMKFEYKAITDAGLNLQVDSPDLAMGGHTRMIGTTGGVDWKRHLPLAIESLNATLEGIPAEQVRLHVCWGNYAGPHHHDVPLADVVGEVLKANVGSIYVEGGNPRHEHEWRVFEDVPLPDDKKVILGVIDVKTNYIEHPRVVAERLTRLGKVIGKERVVAGTDCGFATLMRDSQVDPDVAWLKLKALADGAELASSEL
ncbi:MAG: cobalamin-independent methionine synthase II family protein [Actinobacteria bacterium]|nr:cobalamin-independent methionine synthase II family protein [Actinomycetota bacterium]